MKLAFCIVGLFILLTSCGNSHPKKTPLRLTGNIQADLEILLPRGTVKADIMDGVLQSPRQIELTEKFQSAIKENYDWFLEYMKTVPEGEPMPYHAKLGLTKEEYTELVALMNHVEIFSTGEEVIAIETKGDFILFKSTNKLSSLNSLFIDLKDTSVHFKQYKLTFADTLNITTEENAFKSKWKGYKWQFEEPKNLDVTDLGDLSTLKMKQYTFTIGRLERNGKTYMSLKGREAEDGVKRVDFELPVQF